MKLRPAAVVLIAVLGSFSLQAQSNRELDALLAQPEATFAQTAYLVLVGGGWIEETASPADAFTFAQAKKWVSAKYLPDSTVELDDFALLAMSGLKKDGGLGWKLFHNRRYALREMVAYGVANASGGIHRIISGEEVIRMIGKMGSSGGKLQ